MGQIQGGGGKVHEAQIHSRLMHIAHWDQYEAHQVSTDISCIKKRENRIDFARHILFRSVASAGYALIVLGYNEMRH